MNRDNILVEEKRLKEINDFLGKPHNPLVTDLVSLLEKYGGPEEINRKAAENGTLESLMERLEKKRPDYAKEIRWLIEQKDKGAFISIPEYRKKVLGEKVSTIDFDEENAVTLEISSCQFFPDLMKEVRLALENQDLMPGRYIRVRCMKEQEEDGDLLAVSAAMKVLGASRCETLDTKGTDGSNVHLGGPETITGYFGGVGQPNTHPIKWAEEFLYYYTNYGVGEVLNINPGTIMLGYMMYKLGVDIKFKISVFMGNDNPYSVFWTLMGARMLSREDGSTPLIGFNFSNSVDNETILASNFIRRELGLEKFVRFEHHITETWKSIVRQPYNRRDELMELATAVPNISAKHEGAEAEVEETREHPSDILDYFVPEKDHIANGVRDAFCQNYLDKHAALNKTARELTEKGLAVIAAPTLHHR